MATVKISVKALASEKTVFSSAAKNTRDVIETLNNAQRSIGNDRMFDEAKRSLSKLSELLDKRARALEALSDALGSASESYGNAQSQGVRVVSGFKAHKTDFYGNPVHVSAAAGMAAAGAAAYSTAPAEQPLVYTSGSSQPAQGNTGGNTIIEKYIDNHVENNYVYNDHASDTAASVLSQDTPGSLSASSMTVDPTETLTASSAYQEPSGTVPPSSDASPDFPKDIYSGAAADTASAQSSSKTDSQSGDMTAAVITGGIAGTAALAGTAVGLADNIKQNREKKKIEAQIKEAKEKLRQIEVQQSEMTSAASQTDNK